MIIYLHLSLNFSLLEELLKRFENETGGTLIVATLCLLEASSAGLLESELRQILGEEDKLMPPSPFDEKGRFKITAKLIRISLCMCLNGPENSVV